MRLIDADDLKDNFPNARADIFENCRNCTCLDNEQINRIIDSAPTVNGWISVKDSMPEQQGEYLINTRCIVTIGWFSGTNGWVANDGSFYGDGYVTHWMPLPEPPEEEK